jgi:hypothetical protein
MIRSYLRRRFDEGGDVSGDTGDYGDAFDAWADPMGNDPEAVADTMAEIADWAAENGIDLSTSDWADSFAEPVDSPADVPASSFDEAGFGSVDWGNPETYGNIDWGNFDIAGLPNNASMTSMVHDPFGNYDPSKAQDRPSFNHLGHPPQQTINEFITQPAVAPNFDWVTNPQQTINEFITQPAPSPQQTQVADFTPGINGLNPSFFLGPDYPSQTYTEIQHSPAVTAQLAITNPNNIVADRYSAVFDPTTNPNVMANVPMPPSDPRGRDFEVQVVGPQEWNIVDQLAPNAPTQTAQSGVSGLPGGMSPASGVGVPGFAPHGGVSDPDRDPSNPGVSIPGGDIATHGGGLNHPLAGLIDPRLSAAMGAANPLHHDALRQSFMNFQRREQGPVDFRPNWQPRTRMDANGVVGLAGMGREGDTGIASVMFEPMHTRDAAGNPVEIAPQWDDRMSAIGVTRDVFNRVMPSSPRAPEPSQVELDDQAQRVAMAQQMYGAAAGGRATARALAAMRRLRRAG